MKIKVTTNQNVSKLDAIVKKSTEEAQQFVEEEIHATGEDIYNKAISRAPVNYGILKNSGYEKKSEMMSEVGFMAKYAPYVEFGTGSKVEIPEGLEKYAMEFYVNGEGRLPARPFLFNTAFEETQELIKRLKKSGFE